MLSKFAYENNNIRFEKRNGRVWVSLTDMAKASGKLVGHWKALKATDEFLEEFAESIGKTIDQIFIVNESNGLNEQRGTWAVEEVAIEFAGWCNVKFKVWCITQIKTLMETGKVELRPTPRPEATSPENQVFTVLGFIEKSLLSCGISTQLVQGVVLNGVANHFPAFKAEVNEAHKLLAATTESEILLTPTSIGERLGITNRKVNQLLMDMGFQVKNVNAKKGEPAYLATPKGIPYAANTIATGKVGDDASYQHLKWKENILDVLKTQLVAVNQ